MASLGFLELLNADSWGDLVWMVPFALFQLWMLVHAIRNGSWGWAVIIFLLPGLGSVWYFFYEYRASGSLTRGFELPGKHSRKRIRELQEKIHHVDNAVHHYQLGDIYFQKGKLVLAEACYRAALERDPQDIDARAHLGQCLLRQKKFAEARPLLEGVMREKPDHDYGHSMMALAETLTALGEPDNALLYWQHLVEQHSYPRAKVQLAELYLTKNQPDLARVQLLEVIKDDQFAPPYQRRRDRVWIRRAKRDLRRANP
jgi:hypothetical protein